MTSAIETASRWLIDGLSASRSRAVLALLTLTLLAYLPGVLSLPPVDRTEVVFAQASRQMLADGRLVAPEFRDQLQRAKPIGVFWLQMASARAFGGPALDRIAAYRLPSLLGVTAAVLLTFLLLAPLTGSRTALVAAALLAVTPVLALQATLAVAEGVVCGTLVAAQLALLRLYTARPGDPTRGLALLLWSAAGLSIALNALQVPILLLVTVLALLVLDRNLGWLSRLHAGWGVPLLVGLGSPWIVALVLAEPGNPFAGMTWRELLGALGGSQAMKYRAPPLSFTAGLVLGLLPATLLLVPAVRRLWTLRATDAVARFLLAWLAGYLLYLEAISSKPALYAVQALLPAAAIAVAALLARQGAAAPLALPERLLVWPTLVLLPVVPAAVIALHQLTGQPWSFAIAAASVIVTALLGLATAAAWHQRAAAWVALSVLGFAAFLAFAFGLLLPRMEKAWTTERIADAAAAVRSCAPGPVYVVGYGEPSAVFRFGTRFVATTAAELPPSAFDASGLIIAEDQVREGLVARGGGALVRVGCLQGLNFTRGCAIPMTIYRAGPAGGTACSPPAALACSDAKPRHKPCT